MRNASRFTALLSTALLITGVAAAQNNTKPTKAPSAKTDSQSIQGPQSAPSGPPSMSQEDGPRTSPIFWVRSVEIMRSTHEPQLDVVRVRGFASTDGWESAVLLPLTQGTPSDGVLDLAFVGEAPGDNTVTTSYPEIEAIFVIEPGHPFKGVRVHGAANSVSLKALPGYAEGNDPPKGCASCTGKLFVAKGQSAPAGRAADTVVHEEDLPHNTRIIRSNQGIGSLDSNPNRMTILLNEKDEIVMAIWD